MLYIIGRAETDTYMKSDNKPTHISLERSHEEKTYIKEWKYWFLSSTPSPYTYAEVHHVLWHKEVGEVPRESHSELFDIKKELDDEYHIFLWNCHNLKTIPGQEHLQCLKVKLYATEEDIVSNIG